MAEIQTKTEAVIRLNTEEVEEIRGWFSVIDWEVHPLAAEIYVGLGGDYEDPGVEYVEPLVDLGVVQFNKGA